MVAMTIFLVIGGAAMSLFSQHANLFTTQQGEVGLNMTLRNALATDSDGRRAGRQRFLHRRRYEHREYPDWRDGYEQCRVLSIR